MKLVTGIPNIKTDRVSDACVQVNNSGYYTEVSHKIFTARPNGRSDYHLLFPCFGSIAAQHGKKTVSIYPGDGMLYLPRQSQHYTYFPGSITAYYWIHFSGTGVPDLLSACNMADGGKVRIGDAFLAAAHIVKITAELQHAGPGTDLICSGRLLSLFGSIAKTTLQKKDTALERVRPAILKMDRGETGTLEMFAQLCSMSKYHFIRVFQRATGMTPHTYMSQARIAAAKSLLLETTLRIHEISDMLGFLDPLYFSRVFKRATGVSPTQYRTQFDLSLSSKIQHL